MESVEVAIHYKSPTEPPIAQRQGYVERLLQEVA